MSTFATALQTLRKFSDAQSIVEVLAIEERYGREPQLDIATRAWEFLRKRCEFNQHIEISDGPTTKACDYFARRVNSLATEAGAA